MAPPTGLRHECPDCGQGIAVPRRIARRSGARFRCPECNAALLASDRGSAAYYLRLAVPGLLVVALAWLSFEAVVQYGFGRSFLMLLSAIGGPILILGAIYFLPQGAMKVETDQQFQEGWLDRTFLGRAFSGSEWTEKDGEGRGGGGKG